MYMYMVKIQNVEPLFEDVEPIGMATSVKVVDFLDMQILWFEFDIISNAAKSGHSTKAFNDTRQCYFGSALGKTSNVEVHSTYWRDTRELGSLQWPSANRLRDNIESNMDSNKINNSVFANSSL
jgi:hypothetical protein